MDKDIMTIGVVTFNAFWGEKEKNLNRIKGYIEAGAKRGCDLMVFPEMALTSTRRKVCWTCSLFCSINKASKG